MYLALECNNKQDLAKSLPSLSLVPGGKQAVVRQL